MSQTPSINPTHLKTRFAYRFLRAINNLNKTNISRSHRVKMAAYAAMASVVGSRRAWSRTLLRNIRNRSTNHRRRYCNLAIGKGKKIRVLAKTTALHAKTSARLRTNPNPKTATATTTNYKRDDDPSGYSGQEAKLRKLVPGGQFMDACSLLDETAHYINCLAAQVDVMKTILHLYSTTT